MMWLDCGWSFGESVIFIIGKGQKIIKSREQSGSIFCKSCVDFDLTYLAIHMIQKYVIQGCLTIISILGSGTQHFGTTFPSFSSQSSVCIPVNHQSTRGMMFITVHTTEHFACRNCALLWPVSGCCVVVLP